MAANSRCNWLVSRFQDSQALGLRTNFENRGDAGSLIDSGVVFGFEVRQEVRNQDTESNSGVVSCSTIRRSSARSRSASSF
jgi:hypothetical protein